MRSPFGIKLELEYLTELKYKISYTKVDYVSKRRRCYYATKCQRGAIVFFALFQFRKTRHRLTKLYHDPYSVGPVSKQPVHSHKS